MTRFATNAKKKRNLRDLPVGTLFRLRCNRVAVIRSDADREDRYIELYGNFSSSLAHCTHHGSWNYDGTKRHAQDWPEDMDVVDIVRVSPAYEAEIAVLVQRSMFELGRYLPAYFDDMRQHVVKTEPL